MRSDSRRAGAARRRVPDLRRPVLVPPPRLGLRVLARGELVQPQRDALGRAAVVDEHDRRVVLAHEPQELGVDRRPDRSARGLAAGDGLQTGRGRGATGRRRVAVRFGHRLDRDLDPQVELLAHARVDDRDLAVRADEVAPDLLQRILRRGEPDPLDGRRGAPAARLGLEPLEREREVRAALGGGDGVDLVDDHRLDRAERLPRARGEHQVERLGRRDQDVRRVAQHRRALALGRVAGADADAHVGRRRSRGGARGGCARCRRRAPSAG